MQTMYCVAGGLACAIAYSIYELNMPTYNSVLQGATKVWECVLVVISKSVYQHIDFAASVFLFSIQLRRHVVPSVLAAATLPPSWVILPKSERGGSSKCT